MNGKTIIAGLCCLAVGAGAGCLGASAKYSEEIGFCSEYSEFFGAYKDVKESYYKDISTLNKNRIEEEMLKGFVKGFDDRFSAYSTKEDETVAFVNGAPSTVSSGFSIERDDKTKMIKVVTVEAGSQAEKMGLKSGDLITAVGGTDVTPDNFPETAEKLLGKDGTTVELKIKSGSEEKTISFERRNDGKKNAEKIQTKIAMVAEAYPELKSSENYRTLMNELAVTENLIANYRGSYNERVREYNQYVRRFPHTFFFSVVSYEPQKYEYLEYDVSADAPKLFE
jgi:hypothetical protein